MANVPGEVYRKYLACRAVTGEGPIVLASSLLAQVVDNCLASLSEHERSAAYVAADAMLAEEDREWDRKQARYEAVRGAR
jgi:hypothetical protein